jgi:hypothetical protein
LSDRFTKRGQTLSGAIGEAPLSEIVTERFSYGGREREVGVSGREGDHVILLLSPSKVIGALFKALHIERFIDEATREGVDVAHKHAAFS